MRLGICSQRRVGVGRMGVKSSECWKLRRKGKLGDGCSKGVRRVRDLIHVW